MFGITKISPMNEKQKKVFHKSQSQFSFVCYYTSGYYHFFNIDESHTVIEYEGCRQYYIFFVCCIHKCRLFFQLNSFD